MYELEIKEKLTDQQATIEEISKFEQEINAKLPQDYVQFLLQYNGGRPKQRSYNMVEPTHKTLGSDETITWFYTLAEEYNYNLLSNYLMYSGRVPKELIPIGEDSFGNQVCLTVKGDNYEKVYFWDHESEHAEGEEPTYRNVYLAANSFKEFIDKLYEYKLEDARR